MSGTTIYGSTTVCSPVGYFSGCVGIGTINPGTKLEVYRCETDRATVTRLLTLNNNSVANPYDGFGMGILFKGTDYSNAVQCYGAIDAVMEFSNRSTPQPDTGFCARMAFSTGTNGALTERMRISSGGNVGIGTCSPCAKLHINGSTGASTYKGFAYTYAGSETLINEVLFQAVVGGYSSNLPIFLFKDERSDQGTTQRIFEIQGGRSGVGTILTTLANGNVGIGTSVPDAKLHICNAVAGGTNNYLIIVQNCCTVADARAGIAFSNNSQTPSAGGLSGASIQTSNNGVDGAGNLLFSTLISGTNCERMRITSAGATIMYNNMAVVDGQEIYDTQTYASNTGGTINFGGKYNSAGAYTLYARVSGRKENATDGNTAGYLLFTTKENGGGATERMRITSGGLIGMNQPAPSYRLEICSPSSTCLLGLMGASDVNIDMVGFGTSLTYPQARIQLQDDGYYGGMLSFFTKPNGAQANALTERMRICSNGDLTIKGNTHCIYTNASATISFDINVTRGRFYQALTVDGTLTKGGGSFKIDHPLESKKDTYNLYHSFVESPKADLIYRGKVALTDGYATVNIDTAADMSEGTFEVLVKDVQCFTTNENGWNFVKGTISGNILTIESDNTNCNDEISWMVIGERNDKWFRESTMVDENGKTIVEKLKSETT